MTILKLGGDPAIVVVSDGGDGQGRSALAAARALADAGLRVEATISGPRRDSLVAASRATSAVHDVPPVGDDREGYAVAVRDLDHAGWVLPASDEALLALRPEARSLVDKGVWVGAAAAAGFRMPQTVEAASVTQLRDEQLTFPIVVKPTVGRRPAVLVQDAAALAALPDEGAVIAQPYLDGEVRAVSAVVSGRRLCAVVHQRYLRTWPVWGGTSCAAVTVPPDHGLEARLLRLVGDLEGLVQLQFVAGHLIDVNPRVYGSLPLPLKAGVNLPEVAVRAAAGDVFEVPLRPRVGVPYRWLEGDIRHLVGTVRGGTRRPLDGLRQLLPLSGAAHSVWSLADPLPQLRRLDVARRRAGRPEEQG